MTTLRIPRVGTWPRGWLPGNPIGRYPVGFLRKPIECPHFLGYFLQAPTGVNSIYIPFYEGPQARHDWPRKVVFR